MSESLTYMPLSAFLTEYTEKNVNNEYRPVAVGKYGIRTRESIYTKELASDYSKNKLIFQNTLTIGMGSNQIDIGILIDDEIYSVSPAYHTYRINGINPKYLEYCLKCKNAEMFAKYSKRGARQGKSIELKKWITYEIPVYSDEKQAEIVEKLNLILEAIECEEERIQLYDELVKSKFVELFGNPLTPQEFNFLEDIALLERGKFSPRPRNDPKYFNGEYPYIQTGDISSSEHRLRNHTQTLNELGIKVSKKFNIGTIVIAIVGATVGATAILEKEVYAPDSVIGITPYEYNNIFLETLLQFWRKELLAIAPDCARANINLEILGKVPILKVDIDKQNDFAEFVQILDNEKQNVKNIKRYFEELQVNEMHKYFE